jgi:hypothetical protein
MYAHLLRNAPIGESPIPLDGFARYDLVLVSVRATWSRIEHEGSAWPVSREEKLGAGMFASPGKSERTGAGEKEETIRRL